MLSNPLIQNFMDVILFARPLNRGLLLSPADCVPKLKLAESTVSNILGTSQAKVEIAYTGQIPYGFTLQIQRRQRRPIPYYLPTAIVTGRIEVNNQTSKTQMDAKVRFAIPGLAFVMTCTILILIITASSVERMPWMIFIAILVIGVIWMQLISDYGLARQKALYAFDK